MKEDRRIIKRSGLKKPGKQLPKKKGAKRNFAWKYAEEPVIEEEEEGRTALMFAAENGHDKVVELLVEQGADKVKCPLTYPLMAPSHILEYFRRTKPTSMVAPH